jgi:Glyoxalase-like domain
MSLRIRQIVLAARDLDAILGDLQNVLGVQVAFRDPQVAEFGLHNAVMPIGDQFLEVVSPLRPGTAAGRLLERRGDSGYMILLQTDDLDRARARTERCGVRVVWSAAHPDIRAIHLHPKDIGGAIVSLDQPTPPASWRWAGPDWQKFVARDGARRVVDAEIEAADPEAMARRWADVLGLDEPAERDGVWRLDLSAGSLHFVAARHRGDGMSAFTVTMTSPDAALGRARSRSLTVSDTDRSVTIAGARFRLARHDSAV